MTPKDFHAACAKNAVHKDSCVVRHDESLYFPKYMIVRFNSDGRAIYTGVIESVLARKEVELPVKQLQLHTLNISG